MLLRGRSFVLVLVLLGLVLLLAIVVASEEGEAAVINVPRDYALIQDAVDRARPGDTIRIDTGTYKESVTVDKSLTITGRGRGVTFILGDRDFTMRVTAGNVTVSELMLSGGGGSGALLLDQVFNCSIRGVIFTKANRGVLIQEGGGHSFSSCDYVDNTLEGLSINGSRDLRFYKGVIKGNHDGILITGGVNITFTKYVISDNEFLGCHLTCEYTETMGDITFEASSISNNGKLSVGHDGGIRFDNVDTLWVLNSSVNDNKGTGIYGKPYYRHTSYFWILDTIVSGNKDAGMWLELINQQTIDGCTVEDNGNFYGIHVYYSKGGSYIANNTIARNGGTYKTAAGLSIRYVSQLTVLNNTISDHSMYGIYIRPWSSPIPNTHVTIQDCVLDRNTKAGIAFGGGPNRDFLIDNCAIRFSEFGITRVDPEFSRPSELEEITVKDCYIFNCVNGTYFSDGYVANSTFDGCYFVRCYRGFTAAALRYSQVVNCTFSASGAYGMFIQSTDCVVWNNDFLGNDYGGLYVWDNETTSEPRSYIHNNTFIGNNQAPSTFGLALNGDELGRVENNFFSDNSIAINIAGGNGGEVVGNTFMNSHRYAIARAGGRVGPNTFYLNTFINNTQHVFAPHASDVFDNGALGNYWDDYTTRYPGASVIGLVWDTPYDVSLSGVFDNYPLAGQPDTIPPIANAGEDLRISVGTEAQLSGVLSIDDVMIVNLTWNLTYDGVNVEIYGYRPNFTFDIVGNYTVTLTVSDAWGNKAMDTMSVDVYDDEPPVADAGEDIQVAMGEEFTLDGSGSTDNGGIVTYEWLITIIDIHLEGVSVTTSLDDPLDYRVVLTVTDQGGNTDVDELRVLVIDTEPPVADAGEDVEVGQGVDVLLDMSGSTDNWQISTGTWSHEVDGEMVELSGLPRFALSFPEPGVYIIILNVSDLAGNWDTDELVFTVLDTEAPVAVAGEDVTVEAGSEVTFDGSGSGDNVGIDSYAWSFDHGGSQTLDGVEPSFAFTMAGVYNVTLKVADAAGNWMEDTVQVTVTAPPGDETPPVADAGDDRSVEPGTMVTLDASGSTDDVGIVSYSWSFFYDGSTRDLSGETADFTFAISGQYEVTLSVADASGNSDTDKMTVTVMAPGERAWRLGPFVDDDGEPQSGVDVVVVLGGTEYQGTTDNEGFVELAVDVEDLVSPAEVTASASGWRTLEFEVPLDDDGDPDGELPVMKKVPIVNGGEEGSGAGVYIAVAIVAALAVVGLLWYFRRGT